MSRWWTERVAALTDAVPPGLLFLLAVALATLIGAAWYFWPAWIPRRLPRWRRPAWRRPKLRRRTRTRTATVAAPDEPQPSDGPETLPELTTEQFMSLADRLAAQGRYAEAVRERLRGIVRELVAAGVVEHRPGWTITELASAAATNRPAVSGPLSAASRLFSDIWYGERSADAAQDARMREHAELVHVALTTVAGVR